MMSLAQRFGVLAWVLSLMLALSGCAATRNPEDPLEGFNRSMLAFNDNVDRVALKPAAMTYKTLTPSFVQTGIGNFFGNIGDVWTAINNLLQGNLVDGFSDVMRVAVNTTLGWGGVLDIGSEAGMPKHNEDFGQTLGKWGVQSGPYIVLPFLGSSTLRDSLALPLDYKGDPWSYADPVWVRNTGSVVRVVDQRAVLLDASNLIEEAALDRYEFIRDAYLQRRQSKIHNGETPRKPDDEAEPKGKNNSSLNQTPELPEQQGRVGVAVASPVEPAAQSLVESPSDKVREKAAGAPDMQLPAQNPAAKANPVSSDFTSK